MSSHHIVRDKQEPALLIANGESCSMDLLEQLLEWSPFVLVLDGAIDRVLDLGIKIDLVSGDFDSKKISEDDIRKVQFPIEVICTPDQNKTDLEKGLDILVQKGFPAVNIVWATGGRSDHYVSNLSTLIAYRNKIKITLLDDHSIVYPIMPLPQVFIKWFEAGTSLSLIPFPEASGLSTKNLKYSLKNESLRLGERMGNSNEVVESGNIEISYAYGEMLIMECKD
ncbi:MAG: thiamine diphosphokinase [Leadbetterella sp.]